MPHLSPVSVLNRSGFLRATGGLSLIILSCVGCADRERASAGDSLLMRDLTLAGSTPPARPNVPLGDTASSAPPAPVAARSPAATSVRPAPAPRRPAPAPERPATVASRSPAPSPAPTAAVTAPPSSAPTAPTPVPSGASATSPGNGAGSGRRALGSGTVLAGRTDAQICSLANRPGDRFVATLSQDVSGENGARLPAGTPILVEMAQPEAGSDFAFRVKAVQVDGALVPIEGSVRAEGATTDRRVSKGGDKEKVVTGAVVGAILGRVLGGGAKGTIIGAAGGAAAGTAAAARNSVTEHCLPAGATFTVTLSAPLVLAQGVP